MDEGILTGEAVLLDTRPASFASRALGAVLDLLALAVVIGALAWLLFGALNLVPDEKAARAVGVVALATVTVLVPATVETLSRGRSLGKAAMGIRIVRDDGGPVLFRQALVRALTGVFEPVADLRRRGAPGQRRAPAGQASRRRAGGHLRGTGEGKGAGADAGADAAVPRPVGGARRRGTAPGRSRAGRAAVPGPGTGAAPGLADGGSAAG